MQPVLYKYLALYKKLDIPGIGNFMVEETPASFQFTEKQLMPPSVHIAFAPVVRPTNNHFYSFLSSEWKVDKIIAIRRYKEEVEVMLDELKKLSMCELKGIGILRKTSSGSLAFSEAESSFALFSLLPAGRVIRKHTRHTILIGEEEHTKTYTLPEAAETPVYEEELLKDNWQLYALILAIIALLMIGYYYVMHTAN